MPAPGKAIASLTLDGGAVNASASIPRSPQIGLQKGESWRRPARFFVVASTAIDRQAAPLGGGVAPRGSADAATARPAEGRLLDFSCRALDVLGASILLVLLSPLLALIAILVRLDSPGSPIFRQRRVGRDTAPFTVNKFRTMHDGVPSDRHRDYVLGLIAGEHREHTSPGPHFKMTDDGRVTRFGKALRRSSLDELPQLWNVLRGDMSLVGPRPAIPYEVEHYPPHWFARFAVKPGVTGLWQVSGRSTVTLEQMVGLDVEYSHRRSLWLNLAILIRTVPAVLSGRGAS
jgi:lipopolysaccharide/colanic/teichoic acid biosynthesis glycosyltransferase